MSLYSIPFYLIAATVVHHAAQQDLQSMVLWGLAAFVIAIAGYTLHEEISKA